VSLGERLKAGSPGDENEKAGRTAGGLWIITPFWVAVAAGNILQSLDLRAESLAILWSAALLLCWWYTLRLKGVAHGTGRAAQSSLLWLLFALLVCALLGWVNIAIFSTTIILVPCIGGVLAAGIRAAHPKLEPVITMPRGRDLAVKIVRTVLDYPNVFIISVYFGWAGYLFYIGNVQLLGKALSLRWEWRSVSFHLVNIPLIIAGYFAARSGITVVQELIPVFHRSEEDSTEGRVLSLQALTGYIVWILYVMVSLSLLGFSMGHLALVAGGLSVGIGFGLQQTVNNFISGLILLLGRDIQPGDMLERDGSFCRVEKVTIRNTILRTYTGKTIVVPNSEFVTKPFFNWTYRTSRIRGEIVVRVVAAADSRQVEELLLTVVRANPRVLKFPAPSVRLDDFGGGKLEFSLRIWVAHPGEWGVISDLRHEINRELREKGIAMA
jgi:small-conductance mechanosensitive channel